MLEPLSKLKEGNAADLVVVSHDPRVSLETLSVEATMKAGLWTYQK
jgi:imidazolonepropionase-like amidohydrolase